MQRATAFLMAISALAGCSNQRPAPESKDGKACYLESGYLDSSNGCSVSNGYPDCYLVCPEKGTRRHL